jgi:hypothetical protein
MQGGVTDPPNSDTNRANISVEFPVGDGTPQAIPQDPDTTAGNIPATR